MRGKKLIILAVLSLAAGGCIFKSTPFRGVISYRDGRVYLKHDRFYRVGILPDGWERLRTRARAISFYNPHFKGSISTDAFCGRSVGDQRLESLTSEIVSALEDRTMKSQTKFDLDGRGAIRQRFKGTMDGVPVIVDVVVVRKDGCAFDFYAVMPTGADQVVEQDFEIFFGGFHYAK